MDIYSLGLTLYELARQGDASAQDALGMRRYTGRGVQQNYEAAVSWFRKGAELGSPEAMLDLAQC